jgi:hypothetical protein
MIEMNRNPFNICTLDPKSNCTSCKNNSRIDCKLDKRHTIISMIVIYSFMIISLLGLFYIGRVTGIWWFLIIHIIFIVLFFIVIEPRVTCSHCPYYAEKRPRFNCTGNMITPKIWKFHPEPINKYEKSVTIIGFMFLGILPMLSMLYGIWFFHSNGFNIGYPSYLGLIFVLISTILAYVVFISLFLLLFCPRCINFSCYFNKVPKAIVDEYLKKNPVIKTAWEKNGYKLNDDKYN